MHVGLRVATAADEGQQSDGQDADQRRLGNGGRAAASIAGKRCAKNADRKSIVLIDCQSVETHAEAINRFV